MAVDQIHHTEKTETPREAPANPHANAHFDSHQLLQDWQKTVGAKRPGHSDAQDGATHDAKTQDRKEGKNLDHLIMSDPYAGLQGKSSTRGTEAKDRDAAPPVKAGDDKRVKDSDGQPIKIVGKPENFDPKRPTVAVLDDFKEEKEKASGLTTLNHGEITAKAAEAKGFNVYRIQTNESAGYGQQMQALDAKIKSGELPLGKGDAVNISLGQPHDLPIEGATKTLGVPATNETLAQNKDRILHRFEALSKDKNPKHADSAQTFGDVVESNAAIKDMQNKGIKVLHAAGNEGSGLFSAHFLNATELNSTKPNGKVDSFSADHNLTVRGDGVLPVTTRPADPFSKTSLYQDKGSYEINLQNGKKLSGPITDQNRAWTGDRVSFDRNQFDVHSPWNKLSNIPNEQPTSMLSGEPLDGRPMEFNSGGEAKIQDIRVTNVTKDLKFTDTPDTSPKVSGLLSGTSFSGIGYLDEHYDEMARIKREGR